MVFIGVFVKVLEYFYGLFRLCNRNLEKIKWKIKLKEHVVSQGYNCSRCLFSSHCRGCEVLGGEEVVLQAGDTLCVRFTALSPEHHQALASTIDHPSLNDLRQNVPLTLYDCLRAFTQR